MKRTSRKLSDLTESLHERLNSYALAASAAGVSLLALAQPAEGKIVYTPAHVKIAPHSNYGIDLDHNGTADIYLVRSGSTSSTFLYASLNPNFGNGVAIGRTFRSWALAIVQGAIIGPARKFAGNYGFPELGTGIIGSGVVHWKGPWVNGGKGLRNRYLGIKFSGVRGQFHFGWARLTITIDNPKRLDINSVLLTGYAYETIPNKPIITGKTHGLDVITLQDASLGHLARGASAIPAWREESAGVTH